MKLALSAGALALSMALAGCGGSSSSGPVATADGGDEDDNGGRVVVPFDRTTCTTESGTPYVNAAGDACVASCGTGQVVNTARNQCIAEPARNLAGGDKARKLKAALGRGYVGTNGNIQTAEQTINAGQAAIVHSPTRKIDLPLAGTTDVDITLKEKMDANIAALGEWKGTHFEGTKGIEDAKHTGMLRAYSNKEAAQMVDFANAGTGTELPTGVAPVDGAKHYTIDGSEYGNLAKHIKGDGFGGEGLNTYAEGKARTIEATLQGAKGTYVCTTAPCTGNVNTKGEVLLAGTWTFEPDENAKRAVADANYLEFGWWKREDHDNEATHATAYFRAVGGASNAHIPEANFPGSATVTVSAIYNGKAAGLFAIRDQLASQTDDSGSFTADAKLEATFRGDSARSKLKGEITNFRLDGSSADPGWKVVLNEQDAETNGFGTNTSPGDTVWSIGGNNNAKSGSWLARMYDDKSADDGNDRPESVAGTFHSAIGVTHEMRGAFGASRK